MVVPVVSMAIALARVKIIVIMIILVVVMVMTADFGWFARRLARRRRLRRAIA